MILVNISIRGKNTIHEDEVFFTVYRFRVHQLFYCNFNLVVGRKILLDIMSD
jgi:hypothetical protein